GASYPGLTPVVRAFSPEVGARQDRACIGVPCPATEDPCLAPNLPWRVDASTLAEKIGIASSVLINDFTAIGHGIAFLRAEDVETLQPGEPKARAPIGLIGAGTGLGGIPHVAGRRLRGARLGRRPHRVRAPGGAT